MKRRTNSCMQQKQNLHLLLRTTQTEITTTRTETTMDTIEDEDVVVATITEQEAEEDIMIGIKTTLTCLRSSVSGATRWDTLLMYALIFYSSYKSRRKQRKKMQIQLRLKS